MLEFTIPYYLSQVEFYEEILIDTKSGGKFIPKLEHRFLNIGRVGEDGGVLSLCDIAPNEVPSDKELFAQAIRLALLRYYRSYPNANQYFYIYEAPMVKKILDVIFHEMPADILERYHLTYYSELAEPYAGFSLTSKAL